MVSAKDFKALYGSVLTRIGLGAVAIATTVANIPHAGNLEFDLEKFLAVSAAVIAWVGAEWMSWNPGPHPHDVELRNRLFSLLRPEMEFLRDHDFGNSFNIDELKSLRKVAATWDGVSYRFRDQKIEKQWGATLQRIKAFSAFVAMNSQMLPTSAKLASFKSEGDNGWNLSDATQKNVVQANTAATEIYDNLEKIEDICLQRIGVFQEVEEA